MNKLVFCVCLLVLCVGARSETYDRKREFFMPQEMILSIQPSFDGTTEYYIRSYTTPKELVKAEYVLSGNANEKLKNSYVVKLSTETYEELRNKLKLGLSFKYGERVGMEDGETWCIESWYFQAIKICVQSPEYKTEERGYKGLLEYRSYLDALFESNT